MRPLPGSPHTFRVATSQTCATTSLEINFPKMMLLIVEDNASMRQLIRRLTSDLADRVVECADGSEALAAYEQHHFSEADWVLMDLEMAVMDGLTATRQLCAAHPEARIVIVTRYNDKEVRTAATEAGACKFVPKENLLALRQAITDIHTPDNAHINL